MSRADTRDGRDELQQLLHDFFMTGARRMYRKGDYLVHAGETPPGVFYIESGLVKSYDITKYGDENLMVIRKTGDLLGMTWAFTGDTRQILYTALAPTTTWLVTHDALHNFLAREPRVAILLLEMVVEMYRVNSERILNLEYRTVRERLVSFLLSMAHRFGKKRPDGSLLIDVPLKHQDIASSISATRETTGRAITLLEKKGLLLNSYSKITLLDMEALRGILA